MIEDRAMAGSVCHSDIRVWIELRRLFELLVARFPRICYMSHVLDWTMLIYERVWSIEYSQGLLTSCVIFAY